MNTRERMMAGGILTVFALVAGVFLFHRLYLVPLHERDANIQKIQEDLDTKTDQIRQAQADLPRLERNQELSLPADVDLARREYEKYLSELLRRSGCEATVTPKAPDTRTSPMLPGKKPIYTRLEFAVAGSASLENLISFMNQFYHTGLLHQIKNLSIQRPLTVASPQRPTDLDISLTIEALILNGAANRSYLLPNIDERFLAVDVVGALKHGPVGLGLASWAAGPTGPLGPDILARPARNYTAIAKKNIFFGPPAPVQRNTEQVVEVSPFVYLTDITKTNQNYEAFLYDRYDNRRTRLLTQTGYNSFRVSDSAGNIVVQGKIVQMDERNIIFQADGKYYQLHIGQNIQEAIRRPYSKLEQLTQKAPPPDSEDEDDDSDPDR
ncbi:MAG: hypothetical protein JO112_13225 [Planctomycetes bacterium]|nr:hypothetical protein [Planctomycetota bacterium]